MKHKLSVTLLLVGMFLLSQLIGIVVINHYLSSSLPYGLGVSPSDPQPGLGYWTFSFSLAFFLIFLLMKYKWKVVMKLWFLFVVIMALVVSLSSFFSSFFSFSSLLALLIAVPLAFFKVFRPHVLVHNITEVLIYPGIAAIFVQLLNPGSMIGVLILISLYDMWAVWHSGFMMKMANFYMEELKIFGGFLFSSASPQVLAKVRELRSKYKGKKVPLSVQNKKFKVNLAMLGGGDVVFPMITSGVFLKYYGIIPSLFVMVGALAGLVFLFSITKKGKAYPAMPYLSVGIFIGLLLWRIFFF